MSLKVWIPGTTGTLKNQGLLQLPSPSYNATSEVTSGKLGKAIQGLVCYHLSSDPCPSLWSVACWSKFTSGYSTYNNIILCLNTAESEDSKFYLSIVNNTTLNIGRGSSGTVAYSLPGNFLVNTWYHLAATFDGTTTKLYLNGSLVNSSTGGSTKSALNLTVGGRSTNANGTAITGNGWATNDVRIYDHCLTPQEVKEISRGLCVHYTLGSESVYEATTNIASSLTPVQSGGWGGMTITKKSNNCYHLRAAHTSANSWHTFVYTLPSDCASQTITYSAYISNITTSNVNLNDSWLFIGLGNDGLYPTHGSATYSYAQLKNNLLLSWTGTLSNANRYLIIECWNSGVGSGNTGYIEFDLSGIQIEKKNHRTQYVDGTRSTGTVYDSSGYSNNGTISGTISISNDTPRYDISTVFNGSNSIIKGTLLLLTDYKYTASFWVNPISINSGTQWVFAIGNGSNHQLGCYINNGMICTQVGGVVGSSSTALYTSFLTNTWYHITIVSDGTNVKVYKNGELLGTNAKNGTTTGTSFWIGLRPGSEGMYDLNGKLSDFRVYATALSADDVTALYNLGLV